MNGERTVKGAGSRLQSKAVEGSRGLLTGKERVVRGLRYFGVVFAGCLAWCLLFFATATFGPDVSRGALFGQLVLVMCLAPALLAGLCAMAFRTRRPWHWLVVAAVVLAVGALFVP